ncbi:MAG: archaeal proteasome endopeptidase complex subunit alpha [Candidatus Micrarchaeota archaeon]
MYGVTPQAYDRAITVFSPDGRLFQVEYAKEAVKRGATAIGLCTDDAVALVAYKAAHSRLIVPESMQKIFDVEDHVCVTASGLIADARRLVEVARLQAQRHRMTFNEPAPTESIAKHVCDLMQLYTQYGGIRPFGVSLLVAGVGKTGPELFEAEPSGAMTGYYADSIGNAKKEVDELLEKKFDRKMDIKDAVGLAVEALKQTSETKLTADNVEVRYATRTSPKFLSLSEKDVAKYLK